LKDLGLLPLPSLFFGLGGKGDIRVVGKREGEGKRRRVGGRRGKGKRKRGKEEEETGGKIYG